MLPLHEKVKVPELIRKMKNCMLKVAKIYCKNKSSICYTAKKEKEIHIIQKLSHSEWWMLNQDGKGMPFVQEDIFRERERDHIHLLLEYVVITVLFLLLAIIGNLLLYLNYK